MSDDAAYEKYTLKLHQCSPCFYELLCDGETIPHNYSWITFDDGSLGSEICDLLNKEANEVKILKDLLKLAHKDKYNWKWSVSNTIDMKIAEQDDDQVIQVLEDLKKEIFPED